MGQYYYAVNIDKMEYLTPHNYDNGAKLMEHSYIGNNFLETVESLLGEGRPWYKNRIVWAGDYGDEGLFLEDKTDNDDNQNLYGYVYDNGKEIKPEHGMINRFLLNYTKKEYIDFFDYEADNYVINPLSLLTVSGNDRGGGDYHLPQNKDDHFVGSWAGDVLGGAKLIPDGFSKIKPNFKERGY